MAIQENLWGGGEGFRNRDFASYSAFTSRVVVWTEVHSEKEAAVKASRYLVLIAIIAIQSHNR